VSRPVPVLPVQARGPLYNVEGFRQAFLVFINLRIFNTPPPENPVPSSLKPDAIFHPAPFPKFLAACGTKSPAFSRFCRIETPYP